ncbi:MAG TPA: ATP-grasp domain-containing protein [Gammaproteobacteria bacterium]|nr:ATP-grasp domain-containing protein [Gammaproteobacteria bacterium]
MERHKKPKKNVLVVCTTCRDRRELQTDTFQQHYNIHFQNYDDSILDRILCKCLTNMPQAFVPADDLNHLLDFCKKNAIDGLFSTDDYPGSIYASILAHRLGLPGPTPQSVLTCQHKYYSRIAQKHIVPEATPDFQLIDPQKFSQSTFNLPFPAFIKPVKSYFSIMAEKILDKTQLEKNITQLLPPDLFLQQLNWFLRNYSDFDLSGNYLIAENLLTGWQVTLEGFVYNKQVIIMGIIDSIMYPGTYSFERFVYPSQLPQSAQQSMMEIAKRFILGIDLDNTFFNIEFMYNPEDGTQHIIEVNPRICSQFADLYEKVDGYNSYQALVELALGQRPEIKHRQGKFNIAASFVLRRFNNKLAAKVPTEQDFFTFHHTFPEGRFEMHLQKGQYLDAIMQDGKSYRYGLIHLGASDEQELFAKFEASKKLLPFEFTD